MSSLLQTRCVTWGWRLRSFGVLVAMRGSACTASGSWRGGVFPASPVLALGAPPAPACPRQTLRPDFPQLQHWLAI